MAAPATPAPTLPHASQAGAAAATLRLLPEAALAALPEAPLMPFDPTGRFVQAVPFGLQEYLELVDGMGRCLHPAKRGAIGVQAPPILQRLGMDTEAFIACADMFFRTFAHALGTPASLVRLAAARQCRALRGMALARRVLQQQQQQADCG